MGGETHWAKVQLKTGDTAMAEKTTVQASLSSPMWERLEAFVREQVQRFIQTRLEEEVTAL